MRRSRGACCRCCSGSSQDAIGFQLGERLVSTQHHGGSQGSMVVSLVCELYIPSSKAFPSSRIYKTKIVRSRQEPTSCVPNPPRRTLCRGRHRPSPWDYPDSRPWLLRESGGVLISCIVCWPAVHRLRSGSLRAQRHESFRRCGGGRLTSPGICIKRTLSFLPSPDHLLFFS